MDFVEIVYKTTRNFSKEELYGLTNQLRRAAVSVPSNRFEGQTRSSSPEFRNFLCIARISLAEVETQLLIAERLRYIKPEKLREILELQIEINKMTNALRGKLTTNHESGAIIC